MRSETGRQIGGRGVICSTSLSDVTALRDIWWRLEPPTSEGFCVAKQNQWNNNYGLINDRWGFRTDEGCSSGSSRRSITIHCILSILRIRPATNPTNRPKPTIEVSYKQVPCGSKPDSSSSSESQSSKTHETHINEPHCCSGDTHCLLWVNTTHTVLLPQILTGAPRVFMRCWK